MIRLRLPILALLLLLAFAGPVHAESAAGSLGRTLPSVKLDGVTLKDAIAFIQDSTGANLHVNWKALETAGVRPEALIDLHLRDVSVRKTLDLILSEAAGGNGPLTYTVSDNVVEITTQQLADQDIVTRVFPVDDLLLDVPDFEGPTFDLTSQRQNTGVSSGGSSGGSSGSGLFGSGGGNGQSQKTLTKAERAKQLIDLITSIIRPDIWQSNGGTARIRYFNGNLIISAPRSVLDAIGD